MKNPKTPVRELLRKFDIFSVQMRCGEPSAVVVELRAAEVVPVLLRVPTAWKLFFSHENSDTAVIDESKLKESERTPDSSVDSRVSRAVLVLTGCK